MRKKRTKKPEILPHTKHKKVPDNLCFLGGKGSGRKKKSRETVAGGITELGEEAKNGLPFRAIDHGIRGGTAHSEIWNEVGSREK